LATLALNLKSLAFSISSLKTSSLSLPIAL
jgi:hypothetical protein